MRQFFYPLGAAESKERACVLFGDSLFLFLLRRFVATSLIGLRLDYTQFHQDLHLPMPS